MTKVASIPIAGEEYSQVNEQIMRRTVEQELQSIRDDLTRLELKKEKTGSLAMWRYQFLHMGSAIDGTSTVSTAVRTINTTTYTLTITDHNTILLFTHASGCTVTGPVAASEDLYNATNAFICHLHQEAAAQVTFVPEGGASTRTAIGLKTRVQYSSISIIVIATSTFKIIGDAVA